MNLWFKLNHVNLLSLINLFFIQVSYACFAIFFEYICLRISLLGSFLFYKLVLELVSSILITVLTVLVVFAKLVLDIKLLWLFGLSCLVG